MEIAFQNRREDFEAFYDYMVRQTAQGKAFSAQEFRLAQEFVLATSAFSGIVVFGVSGLWRSGLLVFLILFLPFEMLTILISGFKPRYYLGMRAYRRREKSMTPKDLQLFQLPRTLIADDQWLELRSTEAVHRWRWRRVDHIGLTPNFIFIHVGACPVVYVPKRDFPSEQRFLEFGQNLAQLRELNKDQPIGAE